MGVLSDLFWGGDKEVHDDGSVTERLSDGASITRDPDGDVREVATKETSAFFGVGEKTTVTRDGEGNIINTQRGW
jgi:hypothetical protein